MDWGQCAPLPPGKKAGSCGSGWRDATVVACWRDGSFRVRVHGQAWEFESKDEKTDYRLESKGVTHLDFASPRTQKGRKLLNKTWRYPPAPRRQVAAPRPSRATQPAGAARRAAPAGGRASQRTAGRHAAEDKARGSSDESGVESDESDDDGEAAEEVRCPEIGERVELRIEGSGGGRKGKRKAEEWKVAEVGRVFRGGAFEAQLLDGDAAAQLSKTKYNVADVRVTWRWEHA